MIESLLENNNVFNNKNLNDVLNILEDKSKSNHELFLDYLKEKNITSKEIKEKLEKKDKNNGMENNDNKENKEENKNMDKDKKNIDYTKFDKLTYPELQSKRDELIQERKSTNNIVSKIPIKTTYKGQIEKRNELEKKLEEINCDLAIIKLRMKKLKS